MNMRFTWRTAFLVIWDILATYLALTLASITPITIDEEILVSTDVLFNFGILAIIYVGMFMAFRLYNNLWEYASVQEMSQLILATIIATFLGALIQFVGGVRLPIRVYFIAWVLFLFFSGGMRFAFRFLYHGKSIIERPPPASRLRTLIVGAGETGSLTIRRMSTGDYAIQGVPIIAVDDDPHKKGLRINDIQVAGTTSQIVEYVKRFNIEQIVVAIPSASAEDRKRIYDICLHTNCRLLTLPNVRDLRMDELDNVRLRKVDLNDLLAREEVMLNTRLISG